jgi:hypothetical protein
MRKRKMEAWKYETIEYNPKENCLQKCQFEENMFGLIKN